MDDGSPVPARVEICSGVCTEGEGVGRTLGMIEGPVVEAAALGAKDGLAEGT